MNNIKGLPPFKRFCVTIGNLPSSYVDSMSYYECLMWLCKFLQEQVIPTVNENAEAVNELINWFNNLDVQDEIDKKLDEMVESGQLQEIISEYLNSKAVFGFDTVADMKSSTNLINGSYARTMGFYQKNDGGSANYLIRNITNDDVVDEMLIIALDDDNLVAELITETNCYNVLQLGFKQGSSYMSFNNDLINSLLKEGITLIFPDGSELYLGVVNITHNNLTFTGGGSLHVSFKCNPALTTQKLNINNLELYGIDNLPIIEMARLLRSEFKNNKFYNCDKAIMYDSIDNAQQVSRIIIDNNYFLNVNYALYGVRPENAVQPLIVADIHFTNNMIEECKIAHIHVEGFDGGIISNNTMFFPSYTVQSATKENNIYINYCNWTIISNNNLFEAGLESIKLMHSQSVRVTSNNIAWSGQREQVPAIHICEYDHSGEKYNFVSVVGNHIMNPTASGVKCDNTGYVTITSNNIFGCDSEQAQTYYYGTEPYRLGAFDGIHATSSATKITIIGNDLGTNNINNSSSRALTNNNNTVTAGNDSNLKYKEVTGTLTDGNAYGYISMGVKPVSVIPLYNSFGSSYIYEIHTDNTIQIFRSSSSGSHTYKFGVYYINNSN